MLGVNTDLLPILFKGVDTILVTTEARICSDDMGLYRMSVRCPTLLLINNKISIGTVKICQKMNTKGTKKY